jgi:cytochrome c-type biogenesis protein CcmH/NrfF
MTLTRRAFMVAAVAAALGSSATVAQDPAVDRAANDLYNTVMSPFCPGRTLAMCPSPQAAQLRDDIKARLAAGESKRDIEESLYQTYGEIVLAKPRAVGFGLFAWAVPILFFAAGAGILVWWLRGTRDARLAASAVEPELADDEQQRLALELAKL